MTLDRGDTTQTQRLGKDRGNALSAEGDTTQTQMVHFTKMHGCGNNYIYVYLPDNPISNPAQASIEWSRQGFGIGSDGLITIDRSDVADFRMRIYNNDGSEAMMCGNGVRCCGKFVRDHHLTEKDVVTFETLAGIKTLQLYENEEGEVTSARVEMGAPVVGEERVLSACGRKFMGREVSMGNPHFVIFIDDDIDNFDVARYGSVLERDAVFPDRSNIEFVNIVKEGDNTVVRMRVWERGSGITLACGTGACATSVAATVDFEMGRSNTVRMDGGDLHIEWGDDNLIYMTGPAVKVFEGEIKEELRVKN